MAKDKEKVKNHRRTYYLKNKELYSNKRINRRIMLKEYISSIKNNIPCMDCHRIFPSYAMDFDHRENKKIDISKMSSRGYSKEKINEEIKKCDLVCAVCHRIRTHKRMFR